MTDKLAPVPEKKPRTPRRDKATIAEEKRRWLLKHDHKELLDALDHIRDAGTAIASARVCVAGERGKGLPLDAAADAVTKLYAALDLKIPPEAR